LIHFYKRYLKPIYPDMLLAILYRSDCISI